MLFAWSYDFFTSFVNISFKFRYILDDLFLALRRHLNTENKFAFNNVLFRWLAIKAKCVLKSLCDTSC